MKLSQEERKKLKMQGILSCSDGEHFAIRVITKNGVMNAKQMDAVNRVAEKFGNGEFCFTTRLTVELMYIPYENIQPALDMLREAGLESGGTGAKVRPVVCCKGTYCVFGLCDTQGIAKKLHDAFYDGYQDVKLPHKFKIAVGGCPNNCVKPDLNDIGLMGVRKPIFKEELCRGCKKCQVETACTHGATALGEEKLRLDMTTCRLCGKCFRKCPFHAFDESESGFRIFIGGRWGKVSRKGTLLDGIYTEEQAISMVEKTLLLFKKHAYAGERLGAMIDRIGENEVKRLLAEEDLLGEKQQILEREINQKA